MLITIFIVIGIILTAICAVAYSSKGRNKKRSSAVSDELESELARRRASGQMR